MNERVHEGDRNNLSRKREVSHSGSGRLESIVAETKKLTITKNEQQNEQTQEIKTINI